MLVFAGVLLDVDATEASLSFEDSPGEALRFLRFRRGLPFNFGAEKTRTNMLNHQDSPISFLRSEICVSNAAFFVYTC